ncbi:MAG: hypothetical protein M3Q45_03820 [Chloroflexota bacterium]|nr:hypothetical protein [Chloroflexota bacterium]
MRKLIVSNMMSLDGYYEGPGKNVMALFDYRWAAYPTDESFDAYNAPNGCALPIRCCWPMIWLTNYT